MMYNISCKGGITRMKDKITHLIGIIKELDKLVTQLEKLLIKIISIAGWIIILIKIIIPSI